MEIVTIRQLEAGLNEPRRSTLVVVRHALEAAGVEFIDDNGGGVGVRFREVRRERYRNKSVRYLDVSECALPQENS